MDIPLLLAIPALIIMAVISAFFSATETSFLAVSKPRLQVLIKQGDKRAKRFQLLLKRIENIIGTVLMCNSALNAGITALTTAIFISLLGKHNVFYASSVATFVATILIVVYVEVMPKLIAINNPIAVALFLARFIQIVEIIFRPVSYTVEFIAKMTLRLFGISIATNAHFTNTIDELRGAIDLHHDKRSTGARAMLHSILDLNEVDVDEIMVHRQNVMMIDGNLGMAEILERLVQSPYTRLPVWQDQPDNIIGLLHVKSFLRAIQKSRKDLAKMDVKQLMGKPWFIPAATTLYEQLNAFRQKKEHFAIVVDEYGSFLGIVTLEDIVEEIVGDINDELDMSNHDMWMGALNEVYTLGSTTIRDLNRRFGWDLPDEDAATIAGLILHESRTIPKINQQFIVQDFIIKVIRRTRNQITLLQIKQRQQGDMLKTHDE